MAIVKFESISFDGMKAHGGYRRMDEKEVRFSRTKTTSCMYLSSAFSHELKENDMKFLVIGRMSESREVIFKFCKVYEKDALKLAVHTSSTGGYRYKLSGSQLIPAIMKCLGVEGEHVTIKLSENTSINDNYIVRRVIINND